VRGAEVTSTCAQAVVPSALKSDTPKHYSWKVVEARATVGEGYFPATTEYTKELTSIKPS